MDNCLKCNEDQWTDERRDKCIQRETEYLSFHDYLGSILMGISLCLCATATLIYLMFYRHRTTCIVRANNLVLSYILLFSLTVSFLSSLLFIGRPRNVTCLVRQVTFGVIFATALSAIIGKTITVIIAFSATKPGSKLAKWTKTQITYRIVLLLTNGQVVICSIWLICSPPFPDTDTKSKTGMIIVLCNEGSVVAFYIMIGYIGILAIVSFLLAYYARRLPDSFNESQLITFSMLVFCSVWVSFIPAYINTKGRSVVAVEVFAILTSNAGLLGFIFIPKCYIILFRPELNNKKYLMRKI
uniref:G-protein coupled receptors family 3 profile domain-containing protein n=1 Tax=Xenopus tropicalis TaxID=8364 RepID=A0A803JEC6_XENTR